MNVNIHQLKTDIAALRERILPLKKELRSTWTRPMGAVQRELLLLQQEITDLHILRAHARGRVHIARDPDRCRETAERLAERYRLEVAA